MCNLGSQLSSNRRRRSGSRTSHGSHGKTLRLSFEQKLGISNKEVERHEANLSHFRSVNFLKIFIYTKEATVGSIIIPEYYYKLFFFTILEIKSRIPANMGLPRLRNELWNCAKVGFFYETGWLIWLKLWVLNVS